MKQQAVKAAPVRTGPAPWMLYAILCGIALVAYANSFGLGLPLDAQSRVLQEPRIQSVTADNVKLILTKHYWWPRPVDRLYRPVTLISFLFNYAVLGNGADPAGYHVVNLLLHMLNVCLLFELAMLVLRRREVALFAAALWAVLPVHTEAVVNIVGRSDELGAAAVFGGLLIYIRSLDLAGTRKHLWLAALFVVAILGFFSKENAVVLVGLMVLWDVAFGWERKPGLQPRQTAYLLMLAALLILAAARWKVFEGEPWPDMTLLDNPMRAAGWLPGRLTAIEVIGRYLWLLVWPATLSFDYAYNQVPVASLGDFRVWLSLLVVVAILAVAILRYRKDRTIFWAVGFFGIALLPTSNLFFAGGIMGLRFLYLPAAGFAVAAAALAFRLERPQVARAILAVVIVAMAARTLARNPAWRDNLTLGTADVVSAPNSFRTHEVLALALYEADPKQNLDAAIREYEATYRIVKDLPPAERCPDCLTDLGTFYYAKAIAVGGEAAPEGRAWFEKAVGMLEDASASASAHDRAFDDAQVAHGLPLLVTSRTKPYLYLARAYTHVGRLDDALRAYLETQHQDPELREVYDGMATILATQGKLEQAAIVIGEKSYALGMNTATEASLRNLYGHIPGGECALRQANGRTELNADCPRVRADLCVAWTELEAAYRASRRLGKADALRAAAIGRYGCPATAFGTGQ